MFLTGRKSNQTVFGRLTNFIANSAFGFGFEEESGVAGKHGCGGKV